MNNVNCPVVVGRTLEPKEWTSSEFPQSPIGEARNVSVILNIREPPFEHLHRIRLYLAERHSFYPARLGGKVESAAAPSVISGIHKEYGVGLAWLAERGHTDQD